ncbi:MAG: hypothetical protein PVG39_18980 [Desulfobacteraceae bacterium]
MWITAFFFETIWIHNIALVLVFGFLGVSDTDPVHSLIVTSLFFLLVSAAGLLILRSGYKLRE